MAKMAYFYEELLLDLVIKAQKEIEKRLKADELRLACECATQCTAYAKINGKNGVNLFVARARFYNSKTKDYDYHVQLLDEDLRVLESMRYRKAVTGDWGYGKSEYVRCSDGYPAEPLMHIAATVLKKTRTNWRQQGQAVPRKEALA